MAGPERVEASIEGVDWNSIAVSLRRIWPTICEAARKYLAEFPTYAAHADRLRVYVRPDGGDLYFRVCSAPPRLHEGDAGAISIPYLESQYFSLTRQSEDDFELGHEELLYQVRNAIQSAFDPKLSPLPVYIMDYDDLETETRLIDLSE